MNIDSDTLFYVIVALLGLLLLWLVYDILSKLYSVKKFLTLFSVFGCLGAVGLLISLFFVGTVWLSEYLLG